MKVCANVNKDVANYYKDYDLSEVIDILLSMYDITTMPAVDKSNESGRIQLQIDIINEEYLNLYKLYGPRSTKISLARLLDFGYNMLILDNEIFNSCRKSEQKTDDTSEVEYYLEQAKKNLKNAYNISKDDNIKNIYSILEYTIKLMDIQ